MSTILHKLPQHTYETIKRRIHHYHDLIQVFYEERQNVGTLGKMLNYIDYPFYLIRKYTIPPGDAEDYDHHYTVYWPFLGIPAFLFLGFDLTIKKYLLSLPV